MPEDVVSLTEHLCDLLRVGEFSANELCKLLNVDFDGRSLKKYLNKVPDLNAHKVGKTMYYTLKKQGLDSTLF